MTMLTMLRRLRRDERGVSAVIVIILVIFVLIPLVALAVDGGLLWRQHIGIGNANDAAALAAAQTYATAGAGMGCTTAGTGPGDLVAKTNANAAAHNNVSNAVPDTRGGTTLPPYNVDQCTLVGTATTGQVTVRYMTPTNTFFSLFNGGNPIDVTGKAIAIWGFASAAGVAPFSLDLTACPLLAQPTPPLNTTCQFSYDNNNNGAQARWGGMNLDTWGTITNVNQSCDHSVTKNQYADWENS